MDAVRRGVRLATRLAASWPEVRAGVPGAAARRLLDAMDVRIDGPGERLRVPGPTGTLVVANHVSWLDVVALVALEPMAFLAKREVGRWPVLGSLSARLGTVFVDRSALRSLPADIGRVAALLRAGRSVVVFPEATTWCGPPGGRFRRAAFQAALGAGAPVRPVTFAYTQGGRPSTVAAFVGDDTLAASLGRVLRADDLRLRITAHPPLPPVGDRRALAAAAREAVCGADGLAHA
ncbi:1-acyl-sn-glycerol-3-phosphate acyltransferases [Amycolatopsis arida]|uniref:1-acyl-sn-glycerol-3-phosphate acyltransferases n=1 Tax=Amycolatopsis arida TaxID=587909 RepID=A0A1I5YB56_9PSEU|nr:lysophospholipid acyltransferase family protein [Amycolatopsis arida]TDX90398.1 1-acyl-sn-glycerol-3-phosphate acyltransferase [Amycolatopsis arida]SFQ41426.1 1-acyl-sn-glycerol-3-phosphate acyltransferases [Amycolatopsis arida]